MLDELMMAMPAVRADLVLEEQVVMLVAQFLKNKIMTHRYDS